MAYTRTWDATYETIPADANNVSEGATKIRNLKVDIRERLEKDHYFQSNGTDADHGEHKWVTLRRQANAPANTANKGFVYTKASNGVSELFYKSDANIETQITAAGSVYSPSNSILYGDDKVDVEDGAINFRIGNVNQIKIIDGVVQPITANDIDLGSANYAFKSGYITGSFIQNSIEKKIWKSSPTNAANVTFTGLSGGKVYQLRFRLNNVSYSNRNTVMLINGDTSGSNYSWAYSYGILNAGNQTGGGVADGEAGSALIGYGSNDVVGQLTLYGLTTGNTCWTGTSYATRRDANNLATIAFGGEHRGAEISNLTILAALGNITGEVWLEEMD